MSEASPMSWARVTLAWVAMIGVDLLFHAGLFAGVFDQAREPNLLSDAVLFRRIPAAYATLLVAAAALAWLLDRTATTRRSPRLTGAVAGAVIGVLGLGAVWTAVDITGLLVGAGFVVLIAQGAVAATVLTWQGQNRPLAYRVIGFTIAAFIVGQVAANLLG